VQLKFIKDQRMNYPVYRKYNGLDTWFKIVSDTEFFELKRIGKQVLQSHILAEKFPEKQFIQDMLQCYENRWVEVNGSEVEHLFLNIE
jgi:hypothetical protein